MFHLRYTAPSLPDEILSRFEKTNNYIVVSHRQESFHFHVVGKLNCSDKTLRNQLAASKKGNKLYQLKACDEGMFRYVFHPGSNYTLITSSFLPEKLKAFELESVQYYEDLKQGKVKASFLDQLMDKIQDNNGERGYEIDIDNDKELAKVIYMMLAEQKRGLNINTFRHYMDTCRMQYYHDMGDDEEGFEKFWEKYYGNDEDTESQD